LRWINSFDLRLISDELLKTSIAELTIADPTLFCIYGLEENGAIQRAVVAHYCPMDHHIHIDFFFGGKGVEDGLMDAFKSLKQQIFKNVRGVKVIKTEKVGDL
jgi:hypothetical protein